MRHCIETKGCIRHLIIRWRVNGRRCKLSAQTEGIPAQPQTGSLEQFITEHYWGYAAQRSGGCVEYRVSHVPWQVWSTSIAGFEGEAGAYMGRNSQQFFGVLQTARSWQMVRL